MKVVLSQVNVGSKFRFMPSGVSSSLSNYPRDGWLTEAAARKWAKANGHEIVKVEKVAGNGEKIHRIEYTYKDRFGKTKKQTSELVGKDVEPLKKRIVEGLTRNGDTLVSFGKITTKDSAEDSLVQRIADKYAMDADEKFFFEVLSRNGRVISRIKAPETISKAIAFRLADQESAKFKKPWAKCRIVDSKGKTFETYNRNFKTNEFVFNNMDASDDSSIVSRIAEKYAMDATLITAKGFVTAPGLPTFKLTFDVIKPDGTPTGKKVTKNIGARDKNEAVRIAEDIERKDRKLLLKKVEWAGKTTIAQGPQFLVKPGRPVYNRFGKSSKDSADFTDAAMGIKISGNEKGTERLIMEKVFKDWLSPAAAWQKVKKGNTIMIRFNGNGPNKKLKGKDVLKIEYFNQHVVAMTPRSGGTQLVGFPRINVMVGKLASEGLRSYPEFENMLLKKDSADDFAIDAMDRISAKYCMDKRSEILVYKIFDKNSNIVAQGELGNVNTIPWNDLRQKASNGGKPWKTISVFRKGEKRAIDYITNKDSK